MFQKVHYRTGYNVHTSALSCAVIHHPSSNKVSFEQSLELRSGTEQQQQQQHDNWKAGYAKNMELRPKHEQETLMQCKCKKTYDWLKPQSTAVHLAGTSGGD